MKKLIVSALAALVLSAAVFAAETPKTVMHVINVKFKADAAKADVDAAVNGVAEMAGKFPKAGILRTWVKVLKIQGGFTHCLLMEFRDEAALKAYANSEA